MSTNYQKFNWSSNPFILKIDPKLFTGYTEQVEALKKHIEDKHKIALVTGPTGSGKTTLLKWLEANTETASKIYVSKPPEQPEEFINIFTDIFSLTFFEKIFGKKLSLFNLPSYINKKLKGNHLIFLVDEAHETSKPVLEWLRVIIDQINSVSLVLAGMPILEHKIKGELETLDQRITTRIKLISLNQAETRDLVQKRIQEVGGSGIAPFTDTAIEAIYSKTGGFPREIIKLCDKMVSEAIKNDLDLIEASNIEMHREFKPEVRVEEQTVTFSPKPPSEEQFKNLPFKQRKILEVLSKQDWLTPRAVVENLESSSYKSMGHAVRSINNILHRLMLDGYIQRESRGKAFMYALTPKIKTLFVEM